MLLSTYLEKTENKLNVDAYVRNSVFMVETVTFSELFKAVLLNVTVSNVSGV